MRLDDLIRQDAIPDEGDGPVDADMVAALAAFGIVSVAYRLHRVVAYVGVITGYFRDGSRIQWQGVGATPEEAEEEAIDALAKWILQQQVGATP